MDKLKLSLEDLVVVSFSTSAGPRDGRGTVRAHLGSYDGTCRWDTCGGLSCDGTCEATCRNTCEYTCDDDTCAYTCAGQTCDGAWECVVTMPSGCTGPCTCDPYYCY
ncbi:MAG TPA: hypothetical protein VFQ45_11320 [Longimicrobium sp.]|nr:hypothetical protein [Longimicrobium sp.]